MARVPMWVVLVSCLFLLSVTNCVEDDVKRTMIGFLEKLSSSNGQQGVSVPAWKPDSDPCKDQWQGVVCDDRNLSVTRLFLDRFGLFGTLDAAMLCNFQPLAASLSFLSISGNNISGGIAPEIANCKQLTRLIVSGNKLSGSLPSSLAMLGNLKRLDISSNEFSGEFPDLSRISGLNVLYAQNNQFSGSIPWFDFSNLYSFNVSFNNFSGRIPDVQGLFSEDSFLGNPELCGEPLTRNCSSLSIDENSAVSNAPSESKGSNSKGPSKDQILMYSGYAALGLVIILIVVYKLCTRKKGNEAVNKVAASDESGIEKPNNASSVSKSGTNRSEFSVASESGLVSQSLIVLTQPEVNELKLEDLLRAPAELLGRGKYGSLYKVMLDNGKTVVVKRIKDLATSSHDFQQKMETLGRRKHPFVLSPLAFYSARQEKLLVYEFQENGSLFKLLHGESRKGFDWTSRLGLASMVAEGLAFMHQELRDDGIAHGNLKSCNILLSQNMEARISEYGVMAMEDQQSSSFASPHPAGATVNAFKADVYGFGVILLEMLTGKLVKSDGVDLTEWVKSVVREEWTGEVFDRCLIAEYASEERMVNLLQVAIKCVHRSPEARPSMNQVALMINTIKEEEEKSLIYEA